MKTIIGLPPDLSAHVRPMQEEHANAKTVPAFRAIEMPARRLEHAHHGSPGVWQNPGRRGAAHMPIPTSGLLFLTVVLCVASKEGQSQANWGRQWGTLGPFLQSSLWGLFMVCILKDKTLKLQDILK